MSEVEKCPVCGNPWDDGETAQENERLRGRLDRRARQHLRLRREVREALSAHGTYNDLIDRIERALEER